MEGGDDDPTLERLEPTGDSEGRSQFFGNGYKLLDRIGRGGYSQVWLAHRPAAQRSANQYSDDWRRGLCALKVAKLEDQGRLEEEVRNLAELGGDHHVVLQLDHDLEHDPPYLVMEYLPGPTLAKLVRGAGRLTFAEVTCVMEQIAVAIDYMHAQGYVHRDVKPDNIQLRVLNWAGAVGRVGLVKLIDLGISFRRSDARSQSRLTRLNQYVGTPGRTAPEARSSELPGPACDLFSCGLVAIELLRGELKRPEENFEHYGAEDFERILKDECRLKLDDERLHPLPSALIDALLQATSTNPERRQTSAGQLAGIFQQVSQASDLVRPPLSSSATGATAVAVVESVDRRPSAKPHESPKTGPGVSRTSDSERAVRREDRRPKTMLLAGTALAVAVLFGIAWRGSGMGERPELARPSVGSGLRGPRDNEPVSAPRASAEVVERVTSGQAQIVERVEALQAVVEPSLVPKVEPPPARSTRKRAAPSRAVSPEATREGSKVQSKPKRMSAKRSSTATERAEPDAVLPSGAREAGTRSDSKGHLKLQESKTPVGKRPLPRLTPTERGLM